MNPKLETEPLGNHCAIVCAGLEVNEAGFVYRSLITGNRRQADVNYSLTKRLEAHFDGLNCRIVGQVCIVCIAANDG